MGLALGVSIGVVLESRSESGGVHEEGGIGGIAKLELPATAVFVGGRRMACTDSTRPRARGARKVLAGLTSDVPITLLDPFVSLALPLLSRLGKFT